MLAEMKQNEMNLIISDITSSSISISDMISRPEILVENYLETYAADNAVSIFEKYHSLEPGSPEFSKIDWSKS